MNEFWAALKDQIPEAFAAPNDYALFRSGGVGPMHLVLRDLLTRMYSARRPFVKDEFKVMIAGSELLTNAEFWESSMRNADVYIVNSDIRTGVRKIELRLADPT